MLDRVSRETTSRTNHVQKRRYRGGWVMPIAPDLTLQANSLWNQTRLWAWRHHVYFDLSRQWFFSGVAARRCQVTGLQFAPSGNFAPVVERIDHNDVFTPANSRMVVAMYAAAKGNGTHADVLRMAEALIVNSDTTVETQRQSPTPHHAGAE